MKKVVVATIFFIALLISPRYLYPVYAQVTGEDPPPRSARSALEERINSRVQNATDKVASAEARLMDRKENISSRAAMLRSKLAAFKDRKKATLAEKINDNLDKINTRRTNQMTLHLQKMLEILSKVEERTANATGDKTNLNISLDEAKTAISVAQAALQAQSAKEYTVSVTSEQTIKADVKDTRDLLHKDLKATHDLMVEARQAVAKSIADAITLMGEQSNGQ